MPKRLAVLLALITIASAALAQSAAAPLPADPADCLGLGLGELLGRFGAPASAEAFRGPEAWQDDVVFRYPGGLSFFVYKDRVWQLRFDKDYAAPVYGLSIGDAEAMAAASLGAPEATDGDSRWYRRPDRGYPVRMRVLFPEGKASDIYLYRADF